MSGPRRITDLHDPRLNDFTRLTDVALRRRLEPERGLYLAESEKVIRRALQAGHRPRALLLSDRWLEPMASLVDRVLGEGGEVFTGTEQILGELTGFHLHRGAIASMHRPVPLPLAQILVAARRILVLEDVVDHTNVGAVFRSAAGLGADAVLVTARCADPLYRRAVRVSMGTVFQVPWTRLELWPQEAGTLREAGFTVAALALTEDAVTLDDLAGRSIDRLALVLGTEGDGLSRGALAGSDLRVRIPMAGGVDSLNVAAASAVALWAVRP